MFYALNAISFQVTPESKIFKVLQKAVDSKTKSWMIAVEEAKKLLPFEK